MININKDVLFIIDKLNSNNHEAYIVGGCVRDMLLNKTPKDYDITTSAFPEEVKKCFEKTFDTGIEHGTVTVVLNKKNYEVTTYRIDGKYFDNRHPSEVTFTRNLKDDLLRRDFTMNAIAYHEKTGYIDPFFGQEDIANKIIRGVGNPDKRFKEDALRMMRAVRFSAQLGFKIEEETFTALINNKPLIENISIERIRDEFLKTITSNYVENINVLAKTELLFFINKELHAYLVENLDFIIEAFKISNDNIITRLILFFSLFKDLKNLENFLKFLRLDNKTIHTLITIISNLEIELLPDKYFIRKLVSTISKDYFLKLLEIKEVIYIINNEKEKFENLKIISVLYNEIISEKNPLIIKDLNVNGNDLIKIGFKVGIELGVTLNYLLDLVHQNPTKNEKEFLLKKALELNKST